MSEIPNSAQDTANVILPPPILLLLAAMIGFILDWLNPQRFLPPGVPRSLIAISLFAVGFALAISAILEMRRENTRVEPYKPTTAIVSRGPYRFSRNPIYLGMILWLLALAIALDSLWILAMLLPFFLAIRYGVIAREEAYLTRKFTSTYLDYLSRTRRWI